MTDERILVYVEHLGLAGKNRNIWRKFPPSATASKTKLRDLLWTETGSLSAGCHRMRASTMAQSSCLKSEKFKGVPQQARCGPEGSRRFSLPDFRDIRHMKEVSLSVSRSGRLYHRKCSWYSFSLGAESTPWPWYGRKEYVSEKSSDTTGNRSRHRPTSNAAP